MHFNDMSEKQIRNYLAELSESSEHIRKTVYQYRKDAIECKVWGKVGVEFKKIVEGIGELSKTAENDLKIVCQSLDSGSIQERDSVLLSNLAEVGKQYYHDICICYDSDQISHTFLERAQNKDPIIFIDLIFIMCRSFFDDLQNLEEAKKRLEHYKTKPNEQHIGNAFNINVHTGDGAMINFGDNGSNQIDYYNQDIPYDEILKRLLVIQNEIKLTACQVDKLQEAITEAKKKKEPEKLKICLQALLSMASSTCSTILASMIKDIIGIM